MSRVLLDNELQGLDAQVIQLGSLVDAALAQAQVLGATKLPMLIVRPQNNS